MVKLNYLLPVALLIATTSSAIEPPCGPQIRAMLQSYAPEAYLIHQRVNQQSPDWFYRHTDCHYGDFDIPIAVHESVHAIDGAGGVYLLGGGASVPSPRIYSFNRGVMTSSYFSPTRLGPFLDPELVRRSDRAHNYVLAHSGTSSSSTGRFDVLIDELNAYSHGLVAATQLSTHVLPGDYRDGVLELMYFVKTYIRAAQSSYPETWSALQRDRVMQAALAGVWNHAESAVASSCVNPALGIQTDFLLEKVYAPEGMSALSEIIGHSAEVPASCRTSTPPKPRAQPAGG